MLKLEASAGFEPAYTDLQSKAKAPEIKYFSANESLDMAGTEGERANRHNAASRASGSGNAAAHGSRSPLARSDQLT